MLLVLVKECLEKILLLENFLKSHEDFSLEILDKYEGMSDGFIKGTIRLWPHKLNGEGHFVAMLKKSGV